MKHLGWKLTGLVILAVMAFAVAGFAMFRPAPDASAIPAPKVAPIASSPTPSASTTKTVATIAPTLKTQGQRFVLAVLGDSTGNGPDEWVRLTVDSIVEKTGRTASISTWNMDTAKYDMPEIVGSGTPDLIVYNGSASGKRPVYSSENLPVMLPEKADLVIINHGHNNATPVEARTQIADLIAQVKAGASADAAFALTLQNPRMDNAKDNAALVVQGIRAQAALFPDVTVIDANAAFTAAGALPSLLLPDGLHPSPEGSKIWAQTVLKALSF
ncbi:SGNH/GDSL hydrolase family protein [Paenarthrobacter sp. C1]|uniref:SGNH/GDSL hydrolase family protein n=1 Tax=Paenarthrobacter sp. C1 TaxID=3400220 RepID=UPI003BF4B17E